MDQTPPTYLLGDDFDRKLTAFTGAFLSAGWDIFGSEFANLASFIEQAKCDVSARDDFRLRTSPREYYLLEALAYKIYDQQNRDRFNRTDKTLVIVPDCLTLANPFCERADLPHGDKCISCKLDCPVCQMTDIVEQMGADILFSKRALKEQLTHHAKKNENLGVVGIGCLLMLASGMRTAIELDIPVRGIPLDYCGCDHWAREPFATSFPIDRLRTILEEKDAARNSAPEHR